MKYQQEIKDSDSKVKFGMIFNVASKQIKGNFYSQEPYGFEAAIDAILEESEGRMVDLPLVGV